jgi:CRP/FNR family transcriptional regulator
VSIDASAQPAAATAPVPAWHPSDCEHCPLRKLPLFQPVNATELALIGELKRAELWREADALLIKEGENDGPLYTLLAGWAFRFKTLGDGRRQILGFLLPGDFIGLQQKMGDASSHGVRTLTPVRVCSFRRDALWTLHRELPSLGYDLTWLAANGEAQVDEHLLSVGRRNALERVAALLLTLKARHAAHEPAAWQDGMQLPLNQQHLADAMGLSLVHINRTLRELAQRGLLHWPRQGRLHLPDPSRLAALARLRWPMPLSPRPLI